MLLSFARGGTMSKEALARIESTLEDLVAGQSKLTEGQAKLEAGQAKLEDRQAKLEAGQAKLEAGQAKLESGQATLTTGLEEVRVHLIRVDQRLDKVDNRLDRLEIGQEEMRDQIKQIAEGHGATQAAIARSTEIVIAHIDKRIDPLEKAVRAHFGKARQRRDIAGQ
jgi:uncharacterized phage infection (PIP) family protein YhgE